MKLNVAYFCINCEEIFDGGDYKKDHCPKCASSNIFPIGKWLNAIVDKVKK